MPPVGLRATVAVVTAYLGSYPHKRETPAKLFYATRDRKLAPVYMEPYDGPGRRTHRPHPAGPYCSATYVSIDATCPPTCRFKGNGCYVTEGFTGRANRLLNQAAAAQGLDGDDVIAVEAALLDRAFSRNGGQVPQDGARGGRDLRLHIGGDVASQDGAQRLSDARDSWVRRGGGAVWTFTHRWMDIPRSSWGEISVLASVETVAEARFAELQGYVPAIVVERFASDRSFQLEGCDTRWIPCPAETRGKTCVECRLCLDAASLHKRGMGIAFAIHGRGADKVSLPVVSGS